MISSNRKYLELQGISLFHFGWPNMRHTILRQECEFLFEFLAMLARNWKEKAFILNLLVDWTVYLFLIFARTHLKVTVAGSYFELHCGGGRESVHWEQML